MDDKNKKCSCCKEIKPLDNFGKNKREIDGLSATCKLCLKVRSQKYREANRGKIREAAAKYRSGNREKCIQRVIDCRKKKPEKYNKLAKAYRDRNKGKVKESLKKWRSTHQTYLVEYRKKNAALINSKNRRYQARLRGAGELSKAIIKMLYEDNIKRFGVLTCYLCGKPIPFGKNNLDHKLPLSRGGTNKYDNLGIACQTCNLEKHTKTVEEYLCQQVS
jgi:5-methylcytosine-specific restriction endonuclease McrA